METLFLRFPHLSEAIFDHLENKSIVNCKYINNPWWGYIGSLKLMKIRIIEKSLEAMNVNQMSWKRILKKANMEILEELKLAVNQFYLFYGKKHFRLTPTHIAANRDNISLFEFVFRLADLKNPKTDCGLTPLHFAARHGQWHSAVQKCGFCNIFMMIVDATGDINPESVEGDTPLQNAAFYRHFSICILILDKLLPSIIKDKSDVGKLRAKIFREMMKRLKWNGNGEYGKFIGEDAIAFECAAKDTDLLRMNHIQNFCLKLHSNESKYRMNRYSRIVIGIRDAWGYPWSPCHFSHRDWE